MKAIEGSGGQYENKLPGNVMQMMVIFVIYPLCRVPGSFSVS